MKPVYQKKPEYEQDARGDDERKTRQRLVCKAPFSS